MEEGSSYPPIKAMDLVNIQAVLLMVANNPDYLKANACPYSPQIKAGLQNTLKGIKNVVRKDAQPDQVRPDDALDFAAREIADLYSQIQRMRASVEEGTPKEWLDYVRVRAGLINQLTQLDSLVKEMKALREFKIVLTQTISEVMDAEQKRRYIARLEANIEARSKKNQRNDGDNPSENTGSNLPAVIE